VRLFVIRQGHTCEGPRIKGRKKKEGPGVQKGGRGKIRIRGKRKKQKFYKWGKGESCAHQIPVRGGKAADDAAKRTNLEENSAEKKKKPAKSVGETVRFLSVIAQFPLTSGDRD